MPEWLLLVVAVAVGFVIASAMAEDIVERRKRRARRALAKKWHEYQAEYETLLAKSEYDEQRLRELFIDLFTTTEHEREQRPPRWQIRSG
jgi:hypothetical protein